jgi:hypothetical protein
MGFQGDFAQGINSSFKADGVLHRRVVNLTNAEIKALRASPKVLVPAPGAGWFLEFHKAILCLNYGSNALTESTDNLVIEYAGGQDVTAAITAAGFITATADTYCVVGAATIAAAAKTAIENQALRLFNTGDGEYAGNAGLDTTMTVITEYWIHKSKL